MEITTDPAITVSGRDRARLETLLATLPDSQPDVVALREELDRAQITPAPDPLSVAAPAGVAVLGLAVGQHEWLAPNGQTVGARIVDTPCQPERAGEIVH